MSDQVGVDGMSRKYTLNISAHKADSFKPKKRDNNIVNIIGDDARDAEEIGTMILQGIRGFENLIDPTLLILVIDISDYKPTGQTKTEV